MSETGAPLLPQCSLILTSDASSLSANRLRSIRKYQTPVVGVDYVSSCLQRGVLLPVEGYRLDASAPSIAKSNPLTLESVGIQPGQVLVLSDGRF